MTRRGQYIQKHIGVPLAKSFDTLTDGSIIVPGFFTSDKMDEVGDVITKKATIAAIPKYRQWGNIRYMHMPKPVAKVIRIGKEDGLKWNEVEIHVLDPEAIFQVKNGLLKALSVGIIIRSWDDIDIDESTGGWIINNYDLAEISLVDHPANYDAQLFLDEDKVVPVSTDLRRMVADHGFAMVSKALGAVTSPVTEEIISMDKLEKALQTEVEEIVAEEIVEEELELSVDAAEEVEETEELELSVDEDEEEAAEEAEEVSEEAEEEAPVEEEEAVVEEVLEDMDVRLVDEDEENDPDSILFDALEADEEKELDEEENEVDTIEAESIEDTVEAEFSIEDSVKELTATVKALVEALSEAEAEAHEDEQPEAEKVESVEEAVVDETETEENDLLSLQLQVAELTEIVAGFMKPAKRLGKVKSINLPHEDTEEIEEEKELKPDLLNDAVSNYLSKAPRITIRERQ